MSRLLALAAVVLPLVVVACGDADPTAPAPAPSEDPTPAPTPSATDPTPPPAVPPAVAPPAVPTELHFVFVNGLTDPDHYATAEGALKGLSNAVVAAVKKRAPATLKVDAIPINVYTNLDGTVPPDGSGTDDGSQQDVANKWRSQLVAKLKKAFPNGEKNIILVGHSTGGRVSMEVTANVGADNQVGSANYGFQDRIAGVATVHGMLDSLNQYPTSPKIISFETGCKVEKKAGWCGYAANITSWPATNWVAINKRALTLTGSYDDCGFPIWGEQSDNALPLRAQGAPSVVGVGLSKLSSGAYGVAHGQYYGDFCHSDITNAGPRHQTAIDNATAAISKWLFDSAPVVVNSNQDDQMMASPVISAGTLSLLRPLEAPCPTLWVPPTDTPLQLVGNCSHPGLTDGDDHPMTAAQLFVSTNNACGGAVQWKNIHSDAHAGTVWFKAYAQPAKDPGVMGTLLP